MVYPDAHEKKIGLSQRRIFKASAHWYSRVIAANAVVD
jgi:beta-glucosidase/6-phospho-beta-glucosidase/beta-galactosidase